MKKKVSLSEAQLRGIVRKSVKRILDEGYMSDLDEGYMSDADIAGQYGDFRITGIEVEPNSTGGWRGAVSIEFPNADDVDYDSSKVDNFFVYDSEGNDIAFDYWYPEGVTEKLREAIRAEIAKRRGEMVNESKLMGIVRKSVRKVLSEAKIPSSEVRNKKGEAVLERIYSVTDRMDISEDEMYWLLRSGLPSYEEVMSMGDEELRDYITVALM